MDKQDDKWDGSKPDPITRQKTGWYDKLLERVPLTTRALDIIIALLFILLIVVWALGYIKGNS